MLTSAASSSSRRSILASLAGVAKMTSLSMPRVSGTALRKSTEPMRNCWFSSGDILIGGCRTGFDEDDGIGAIICPDDKTERIIPFQPSAGFRHGQVLPV